TRPEELDAYIDVLERAAEWMESQNLAQWIPGTFRQPETRQHIANAIAQQNSFIVEPVNTMNGSNNNSTSSSSSLSASSSSPSSSSPSSSSPSSSSSGTIAAIFALNYEDPFDEMLWSPLLGPDHWKDAIYVHRLVVEPSFQGKGIVPQILAFVENLVIEKGKTFLRLDCRANNPRLRKFYREKCRGKVVMISNENNNNNNSNNNGNDKDGVVQEQVLQVQGLEERGTFRNPKTGIEYARFERRIVPASSSSSSSSNA
ncbi:hypothetical protein BX616_003910, partial [Lobosporangium transversale]